MKKCLVVIISLFCVNFALFAQEGSAPSAKSGKMKFFSVNLGAFFFGQC
jgi:hypothetical protein